MSLVSRDGVGVNDVGVKGVRDAKESVSCEVSVCEMVSRRSGCRRCSLNGGVPTRHVVMRRVLVR